MFYGKHCRVLVSWVKRYIFTWYTVLSNIGKKLSLTLHVQIVEAYDFKSMKYGEGERSKGVFWHHSGS